MVTKELLYELRLEDQKHEVFQMRYYLVTCLRQDFYFESQTSFGIMLEKQCGKKTEEVLIPSISPQKIRAFSVLNALYENHVTLIDSDMIVDDILDLY